MKTSTVMGVLVGLVGLTLTPLAAQAADAPTIDADVKVGQVVDFSFPCDYSAPDRWFSGGQLITEPVINALTARPEDLGRRLMVERTCAETGETLRTPETDIVTSSGPQVPVIGTLAKPPVGDTFIPVRDTQSSVMGDPTDPGVDLQVGQLGADDQTLVDPSSLTVTVAAVKKGQRVPPLDATGVKIASTGSVRHVSFTPTDRGNVTLVFTVTGTTGATSTYSLDYYASGATTPTSRVLQMSSDASTAIAAGDGHLFVADDEGHTIRLYDGDVSGMPLAVFDPGVGAGEDDYESSARSGSSVFWLGAHGNSKKGEVDSSRQVVYETTISGSGSDAKLTPVGNKYNGLRDDLIAWDQSHGGRYGFAVAAAPGQAPDGPAQFNIEASEFAPDGNTLYLGFRGPLTGRKPGGKALIVPVTNIKQLTRGAGSATFGEPIELDLGGHSIREIRKNPAGEYLLLTADAVPAQVKDGLDQALWYWDGKPATAPERLATVVPRDVEMNALSPGAWEGIGEMPAELTTGAQVRLLMDQGAVGPYAPKAPQGMSGTEFEAKWETPQMKDLAADQLRKARTDVVTLTGAMGVGGSVTGSGAFAEQAVGSRSAAQAVTVTNTGTKPLSIAKVSVTDGDGTSAQTFAVDDAACVGKTLAVGAVCATQVRFAPAKAGAVSAATVTIEGPDGLVVGSLPLTGTATVTTISPSVPVGPPAPTTQHVTKKVKPTVTVKALSRRRMQVTVRAKGVSAAKLTQQITVRIAGAKKAYRVTLVRGRGTIRLTGSSTAKIKNGKKVRVTVLVPRLTATTATPGLVTTYQVSLVTARKTLAVRH